MSEFFVMDGSVRYVFAPPPDRLKVCCTASTSSSRARTARACEPWTPPHRAYRRRHCVCTTPKVTARPANNSPEVRAPEYIVPSGAGGGRPEPRREALSAKAAERGVAVPDHEDYDTWRNVTDFAVSRCEGLMDDPVNYGIHLDYIALREESLGSALTRVRDVLEDDDRHLAATLAGQRAGESLRMREERIARLLDDPEKLRELRQQRAERKAERQQQSKGPYRSMRI